MPSSCFDVPDWLQEHPELRARGIELFRGLQLDGSIFHTMRPYGSTIPQYVVKVLDPATEESSTYQRFQDNPSPLSHALPFEIIHSEPRLLVMPFVWSLGMVEYRNKPTSFFLDLFHQVIEGIEYLHRLKIVHLDICFNNVAYAAPSQAASDPRLVEERVYLIDFDSSRQLVLGPGHQGPIILPPSQQKKPPGVTSLDPYSFDIYCAGKLMQEILHFTFVPEVDRPWIPRRYARWLVGNERGCSSVCHCRPTARWARQALTVLRWLVYAWEFIGKGFGFCAPPPPPAEIDICSLLPSDLSSPSPPYSDVSDARCY